MGIISLLLLGLGFFQVDYFIAISFLFCHYLAYTVHVANINQIQAEYLHFLLYTMSCILFVYIPSLVINKLFNGYFCLVAIYRAGTQCFIKYTHLILFLLVKWIRNLLLWFTCKQNSYIPKYACFSHGPLIWYINCRLRMRRECRDRFPRHRGLANPSCITARA